jgi:hypothetical protein
MVLQLKSISHKVNFIVSVLMGPSSTWIQMMYHISEPLTPYEELTSYSPQFYNIILIFLIL